MSREPDRIRRPDQTLPVVNRSAGSSVAKLDGIRVPGLGIRVHKPERGSVAWYAALGLMTAIEIVEWPVAVAVGVSHALATHARRPEVREAAKGVEAGS